MLNVQQGKQDQHLPCHRSKPREGSGGAHSPCQRCYHTGLEIFPLGLIKAFSSQQAYLEVLETCMTPSVTHKGPASLSPPDKLRPGLTACSQPGCLQCASQLQRNSVLKTLLLPQTAREFVAQWFLGDCPSSPLLPFSLSSCIQVSKRAFCKLHS